MEGLGFRFREIFDVREAFEVGVLGPEGGLLTQSDGVDQGVSHREFVADADFCRQLGNLGVDGNHFSLLHELDDLKGAIFAGVEEAVFPDLVETDGRDNNGERVGDGGKEGLGIGPGMGDFDPA